MSRPIQIPPEGLIGLLQLKNQGQNPTDLLDSVQPTIDALPQYLVGQAEIVTGIAFSITAVQQWFAGIDVPSSEVWFIHSLAFNLNLAAGEQVLAAPGFLPPGATFQQTLAPYAPPAATIMAPGAPNIIIIGAQPKFFVPPGTRFGLTVMDLSAAANIEVSSQIWITRCRR